MLGSSMRATPSNTLVSTAAYDIPDDILLTLGNDSDIALLLRSSILAANTALTGVLIGTPVTQAIAANSSMIANATSNGDIAFYVNMGGHSQMVFWANGDVADVALLCGASGSVDLYTGGTKFMDISNDGTKTTLLGLSGDYTRFGDAATTQHSLASEDDVMFTGKVEFNGDAHTDRWLGIGYYNTFFGVDAGGADGLAHTTGDTGKFNTAFGSAALNAITTGYRNTAVGRNALAGLTTGGLNCALGLGTLGSVTEGMGNIAIGHQAGDNITTGDYNIIIGYYTDAASATANGQLDIGGLIKGNITSGAQTFSIFGVTPVARVAAYTPTSVTPDRAYDADTVVVAELADVVGTLIADLQSYGVLQ